MPKIISLQEISPNNWKAEYQGNYGVYTIRIEMSGEKIGRFSCSCPSDGYPCKHIPMIHNAIRERIAKSETGNEKELFENVVRGIPLQDLQDFTIRFGKHNGAFQQAVLLEFISKQKTPEKTVDYHEIISLGLSGVDFFEDDIYDYYDESFEIDVLNQWLSKAWKYLEQGAFSEAVLIAKACLETFAEWADDVIDTNLLDYVSENYQCEPFDIFEKVKNQNQLSAEELLAYCRQEIAKPKYAGTYMLSKFNNLMMSLIEDTDPAEYLHIQNNLFVELSDKGSHEAKRILEKIIDFYKKRGMDEKAWKIVEENIQIESFRAKVVEELIEKQDFVKSKKLIHDFIKAKKSDDSRWHNYSSNWDEYLLKIAQLENNKDDIRKISKTFIENHFKSNYYEIYKTTFSSEEWPAEMEKLIHHYQKDSKWFNGNVADIFAAEKLSERLLHYLAAHLTIQNLEEYYKHTASQFPEKTLEMFKFIIEKYLEANTGRNIYEHVAQLFDKMLRIKGGKEVVSGMTAQFKITYKNRPALREILSRFSV